VDELEGISKNDNENNQSNSAILIEAQIASSDKVLKILEVLVAKKYFILFL
jgi:hypothetical protein